MRWLYYSFLFAYLSEFLIKYNKIYLSIKYPYNTILDDSRDECTS